MKSTEKRVYQIRPARIQTQPEPEEIIFVNTSYKEINERHTLKKKIITHGLDRIRVKSGYLTRYMTLHSSINIFSDDI